MRRTGILQVALQSQMDECEAPSPDLAWITCAELHAHAARDSPFRSFCIGGRFLESEVIFLCLLSADCTGLNSRKGTPRMEVRASPTTRSQFST